MGFGELILFSLFLFIVVVNIIAKVVRTSIRNKKKIKQMQKEASEGVPEKIHSQPLKVNSFSEMEKKIQESLGENIYVGRDYLYEEFSEEMAPPKMAEAGLIEETVFETRPEQEVVTPEVMLKAPVERTMVTPTIDQVVPPLKEVPERGEKLKSIAEEEIIVERSAWERIHRLSLFKKAVVLSEILGKPRGLE